MLKRELLHMRVSFFITLSLFLTGILIGMDNDVSIEDSAKRFCDALRRRNISHYSTRGELLEFFKSEEDLSNYIVFLYYTMEKAKFQSFEVIDCSVEDIKKISETKADVRYKLTGRGLLFFHKNTWIVDRWEKSESGWKIIPPEKLTQSE